ncbi:alpha/beta fold hydrolase [Nocardia sp. NPDC058176]|uniref:alpha/beta fold hydrolase n=1 Tax=Nocardia sp. NPDC058176 TaxID=3346368 RepID=UPI0036D94872
MITPAPVRWWDDGAQQAVLAAAEPTHVFAAGSDAAAAIALAITHPGIVRSLVIADPAVDLDTIGPLLARVTVPTLVVASAPEPTTELTVAQRLAGDIDNAVFVVIDGSPRPVHTESRASFVEWTSSFVAIAEGLAARADTVLCPPTPLTEGVRR